LQNKDVLIVGNKISKIGEIKESADEIIDGKGFLLMPGLINTHTHASMTLFRGIAEDMHLMDWLQKKIWPLEAEINGRHCYYGALIACLEMIKNGITCFNDMYFYMDDVAKACKEVSIRAVLGQGLIDIPVAGNNTIETTKQFIKKWKNDELIVPSIAPHAPYTCSKELLQSCKELSEKEKVLLHIHLAETKGEQEKFEKDHGMREIEYLGKIGFLGSKVLAAHCCWLDEKEIGLFSKYNIKVSHNPISNMKLSSGIAPVPELLKNNITVSLGTDGAASNNNLDMFETMKVTALLHKLNKLDPTIIKAHKIVDMGTIEGAKSLTLENQIGSIEVGKKADVILIDLNKIHFSPLHHSNIISHLVYSSRGESVDTTICNGEIVMRNRKILAVDENKILRDFHELTHKFFF